MSSVVKKILFSLLSISVVLSFTTVSFALKDDEQVSKLNERGLKEFRNNDLNAAIESWEKAVQLAEKGDVSPDLIAQVFNNYGYGRYRQGKHYYYLAEEYLLKSMRFVPGRWSVYLNLGDLYFDVGAYERARDMYKTLLSIKPDYRNRKKIQERIKGIDNGTYKEEKICQVYASESDQPDRLTCGIPQIPRPLDYYVKRPWEFFDIRSLDETEPFALKHVGELPDGRSLYDVTNEHAKIILIGTDKELYRPRVVTYSFYTPTTIDNVGDALLIKAIDHHYKTEEVELYYMYNVETGKLTKLDTDIRGLINPVKDMALDCGYETSYTCYDEPSNRQYTCYFFDKRVCWKSRDGCDAGKLVYDYTVINGKLAVTDITRYPTCEAGAMLYNSNEKETQ